MSEPDPPSPMESLLTVPVAIAVELVQVIPRLAERTRSQFEFASSVVARLRCNVETVDGAERSEMAADTASLATVVPFEPRSAPAASQREVIEVTTITEPTRGSRSAATSRPATKKTAPAAKKTAPATKKTAPATKKSAPATKKSAPAAKKTAPAKKAPVKKSTTAAKKAPAKKAPAAAKSVSEDSAPAPRLGPVTSSDLAIPEYDALAASQVVPRLESLVPADLELVRRYENEHRARRTILNRVSQLQA